jgi:ribosomal protein S18 acetylase RimI-like enzyme
MTVTTWSLEQTSREDLRDARVPDASSDIRIVRAEVPSPAFSRFLYTAVGSDVAWADRLPWTYGQWQGWLDRPGVETWVAYERGTPAGFIELEGARTGPAGADGQPGPGGQPEGTVEISYFGLLPAFRGRRIGGHLLSYGTARAWDMDLRWPERPPTDRVWVHTCSQDGPHALGNYRRRGFRLFRTEVNEEPAGGAETVPPHQNDGGMPGTRPGPPM